MVVVIVMVVVMVVVLPTWRRPLTVHPMLGCWGLGVPRVGLALRGCVLLRKTGSASRACLQLHLLLLLGPPILVS